MVPKNSDSNHPYHSLHVPKNVPFRLQPSAGKGWGVFASRNIKRGAIILREKPLFVIHKPHEVITERDLWAAFNKLLPTDKRQFLCVRDNAARPFTSMSEAFAENSFAIPDREASHTQVHGCFLLHSRINHSCLPNSKIPDVPGDFITSFATRDIAAGEEIFFCYNTDFGCRTRHDRHRLLRFTCDCKACHVGTPFQKLSDIRRTLARGLQYLTIGVDIDGQRHNSTSTIIANPGLKKAAETFSIPLSARLLYNLLIMVLSEQEGLLDDFLVRRMSPGISILPNWFQTESNARIAKLAMAQSTWLQKFCIALRLWGKGDVADDAAAKLFRLSAGQHS